MKNRFFSANVIVHKQNKGAPKKKTYNIELFSMMFGATRKREWKNNFCRSFHFAKKEKQNTVRQTKFYLLKLFLFVQLKKHIYKEFPKNSLGELWKILSQDKQ